jgi:hypothetical protein
MIRPASAGLSEDRLTAVLASSAVCKGDVAPTIVSDGLGRGVPAGSTPAIATSLRMAGAASTSVNGAGGTLSFGGGIDPMPTIVCGRKCVPGDMTWPDAFGAVVEVGGGGSVSSR